MRTVFSDDIYQIAARLVEPVAVEVHFVREQFAVQCDKRTERIRGKQYAVCRIKSNHGFRPVYHRCGYKRYRMAAKAVRISFCDGNAFVLIRMETKLTHQHKGFFCRNHFYLRIAQQDLFYTGAVIRLHMIYDEPVERAAFQQIVQIFQKLTAGGPVYGIKQYGLFIQEQICVVAYAIWNRVYIFK